MAKRETQVCHYCNHRFSKTVACCPSCNQWNIGAPASGENDGTVILGDAEDNDVELVETGPWDPCFGREMATDGTDNHKFGIPKSSVSLLGGKNGAGKSTMVMQICEQVCAQQPQDVLIISVEEAAAQVKRLGKRLKIKHMSRTDTQHGVIRLSKGDVPIAGILHYRKPALVVVDSLPRLCPDLADAVEFCKRLKEHVADLKIPAIVINHINKEEEFAGLEALQHEVDATLIFTIYDDVNETRELRSLKNRNGPLARKFFSMTDTGLIEVDPSVFDEPSDETEDI
jgi:DNA repair protein RadA/Sms